MLLDNHGVDDDTICGIVGCMAKSPCRFLIPLALNDDTPVSVETFMKIKRALDVQFGGYRVTAECMEGSWQGQVENCMEIEVCVIKKRVPELRQVVLAIGKELGQLAMYFDSRPPTVEILDVETGGLFKDLGEDE